MSLFYSLASMHDDLQPTKSQGEQNRRSKKVKNKSKRTPKYASACYIQWKERTYKQRK